MRASHRAGPEVEALFGAELLGPDRFGRPFAVGPAVQLPLLVVRQPGLFDLEAGPEGVDLGRQPGVLDLFGSQVVLGQAEVS